MEISGYGSVQHSDANSEIERLRGQRRAAGWNTQSAGGTGDTVSFSPEALQLAARMRATRIESSGDSAAVTAGAAGPSGNADKAASESGKGAAAAGANAAAAESAADQTVGEGENARGGGGAGGSGSSSDDASSIESKIKALVAQMQSVLNGPGPDDVKQIKANSIQEQINQLQQQLSELKKQAAQA